MDQKKLSKYKKRLLEEREKIMTGMRRNLEELAVDVDDLPDETDLAATEVSQNLAFKLKDREHELLSEINLALQRIDDGDYGTCEETGEQIEDPRLNAIPWTRLSLEGAEIREKQRKRYA